MSIISDISIIKAKFQQFLEYNDLSKMFYQWSLLRRCYEQSRRAYRNWRKQSSDWSIQNKESMARTNLSVLWSYPSWRYQKVNSWGHFHIQLFRSIVLTLKVCEFWKLLSICHTVMPERRPGNILEYQAQVDVFYFEF